MPHTVSGEVGSLWHMLYYSMLLLTVRFFTYKIEKENLVKFSFLSQTFLVLQLLVPNAVVVINVG